MNLSWLIVVLVVFRPAQGFVHHHHAISSKSLLVHGQTPRCTTALYSSSKKKQTGVYSRPSAAIERGSGFFVPGLEGPKVRLLFGLVVLVLTAANHALSSTSSGVFSEGLAVIFSILLLLQAAIEFGKDERGFVVDRPDESSAASDSETLSQRWSIDSSPEFKDAVQWSAASYIALTPATHMMLLEPDQIVYRLGSTENSMEDEARATKAALETVKASKSGRVSLPPNHPAVALVGEEHGRCVVLQLIGDNQCWMMTSDQLLAAFTSQDLKWLGRLAVHVSQHHD